jgi:hypothetical protein
MAPSPSAAWLLSLAIARASASVVACATKGWSFGGSGRGRGSELGLGDLRDGLARHAADRGRVLALVPAEALGLEVELLGGGAEARELLQAGGL